MTIAGSSKITTLAFKVLWDLSALSPKVVLTNQSVGADLAGCTFWFEVYSSDGTVFHSGSLSVPDSAGDWATITIAEAIPQILGHIGWGEGFTVKGYVNDGTTTYGPEMLEQKICRPLGNQPDQKNNFGSASAYVEALCADKKLYVEDKTNTAYNGVAGQLVSKTYKLIYPLSEDGSLPTPFESTDDVPSVQIPFTVDSDCYQLLLDLVYDYAFGDSTVRIKYKYRQTLEIFCSTSLCSIACELARFEQKILKGGCTDTDRTTLLLLNSMFNRLIAAILQPDCGAKPSQIIKEMEALGGFSCTCK